MQSVWHETGYHVCHGPLQWRHYGHDGVSNHQHHDCLLSRLFRRRSKKTSKLWVTGLCAGNSPGTGEFHAQMASNAENISIWWRHHGLVRIKIMFCADICTTWNNHKRVVWRQQLFNSWISFTRFSLMVHICDKKMRLMLYIFRYFHASLVPIMTAVTLGENLTKKCVCIETCVNRLSWFYVPTMSQYIFNVMAADYWGIFL